MKATAAKELIRKYTDVVWNQGDLTAMERFYSGNYVHHDVSRPDVRTLDEYRGWAAELIAALDELEVRIDDLFADEEGMAVKRWTATGVHKGTLAGIAPTGRPVAFSGATTYRVAGDRIAESWYVYDLFGLLQQIGAIPAPEAASA